MTIQVLLSIIIGSTLALLAIGLLVLTYIFGRVSVKDNPNQALVFVKTGLHVNKPYNAKLSESTGKGVSFLYNKKVVMLPKTYNEIYHRNKRMIFINRAGQIIATPFDNDDKIDDIEKENLIYELCSSHIGADGVRALKGTKTASLVIIAIIAFAVGALLVFGFTQFQKTQQVKTQQTQQQQVPAIQNPVEVR